ncbi:Glutamate-rich WD repeat-containing 1 [Brachionus plicatilis]|uniref:Glutamate-rich WD repeat-containing protein 1 n=1 Tax=Brachionus plicatilis TaxID=10195 RepID=A0A3M7SQ63_BRAPC|nr:Glutamate-rich WD repeat-containing 1 [Brachionus plicatilis]
MEEDELVMDESAYEMYHQAQTNSPCLSFDIINDDLGQNRTDYPHTCYLVSGTQADPTQANNLIVMKMSNLKRTYKEQKQEDEESDEEDSESEDEDDKPELEAAMIRHSGTVNRVRATRFDDKVVAATWSELGRVYLWDLTVPLKAVSDSKLMSEFVKSDSQLPLFQFNGHQSEGFALDWSLSVKGQLATGDCQKNIHVWKMNESGWNVDQRPFVGHSSSVEDIQWSPNETTVFASCSSDKSIRVWDIRCSPLKANMLTCDQAHGTDVNVINWNRNEPFIVSGGDDGQIKIWDLRLFKDNRPVGILKYHGKPITSVEWNTHDSTVFAASSEDNQLSIWDLAVEKDDEEQMEDDDQSGKDLPPQLLFIHQGQKEMKELHWHSQIPGVLVSTAHTGFNIFKTISV